MKENRPADCQCVITDVRRPVLFSYHIRKLVGCFSTA